MRFTSTMLTRALLGLMLASVATCARPTETVPIASARPGSPEDLTVLTMMQPATLTIPLAIVSDAGAVNPPSPIDAPPVPLPPLTDAGLPADANREAP